MFRFFSGIVQLTARLLFYWDRLRNKCRILWLGWRGVTIGKGCYVGPGVHVSLGPGARLFIGENVVIKDYAAFFIGPGSSLEIGANTYIGRYCEIASNANSVIGMNCAIAAFCTIIDTDHGYSDVTLPVDSQPQRLGRIQIDEEVWLGYKVTVLRGVHIGRHTVVGANGVVTRDLPAYSVAVGVPARPIRTIRAEGDILAGSIKES